MAIIPIALNASASVSIPIGSMLYVTGQGIVTYDSTFVIRGPQAIQGNSTFGPYNRVVSISLSATNSALSYYITAGPLNSRGDLVVTAAPDTGAIRGPALGALAISGVSDLRGVYNMKGSNTQRIRAAALNGAEGVISIFSNSQGMGAGAGDSGTELVVNAKANNIPTFLSRELSSIGIYATSGNFGGDQNAISTGITYAQYDPCFVQGAAGGFLQGSLGRLMTYSTGAGALCSYTPPQSFDTVKATFVGNGVGAAVNVDGGASLGTLTSANNNYITPQTITGITEGVHTLNVVAAAANFFLSGLIFSSSSRPGLRVVGRGWYGAVVTNFNSGSANFDTNPTILRNPDGATLVILRITVNDANGATDPTVWLNNMRVIAQGVIAGGSDLFLSTDEPYQANSAVNGRMFLFNSLLKSLAYELDVPFIDLCEAYKNTAYESPKEYFSALHCARTRHQSSAKKYAAMINATLGLAA